MKYNTEHHGFTIVELLVVIVVIAILAAISIVAYTGIQNRAQASAISSGLQQIEKSMRLWAIESGFSTWPIDPVAGGGLPLSQMINDNPSLRQYMQSVPAVQGIHTDEWFYDNEGDSKTECGGHYNGVNLVIRFVENAQVAQMVDEAMDDGNITCGKIRYVDQRIFYSLSYTQAINQ